MLGTIRRILGLGAPKPRGASSAAKARAVQARYDAAQTTEDNRRHWAAADLLSAAAANSPDVRRLLRSRSRYEVQNNSYAKGIVRTLANDRIGTCPQIQVNTPDEEANSAFEDAFRKWAKAVDLGGKLRTLSHAFDTDGEGFGQFYTDPAIDGLVKLNIDVFEADRVASPREKSVSQETQIHDGIEFDSNKNPVAYWVHDRHPGDSLSSFSSAQRIPARYIIHWFRKERPGQTRGVPNLLAALPLFAQLRRYTLAVIKAAETAANPAGILKTNAPPQGAAELPDWESIELEERGLMIVPEGWDLSQMDAVHPTSTYGEFKREILNEIARCLNMPYNVAACNSSSYNYASGRLDHQTYHRSISVDREDVEIVALLRIVKAFAEEYRLASGRMPPGEIAEWLLDWLWPGFGHADPTKDASAQEQRLANNTTTLKREWALQGEDWLPNIKQRAKEIKLLETLGITSAQALPKPAKKPEPLEDEDEQPAKKAA
jgi:lambda family phage portal protein